jgi:hypothetical protein
MRRSPSRKGGAEIRAEEAEAKPEKKVEPRLSQDAPRRSAEVRSAHEALLD